MHVRQRVAPPGLRDEGDDRGKHQDRFQPLPQQDEERRCERRARRELAGAELFLGRGEQRVHALDAQGKGFGRLCALDRRAQLEHLALGPAHELRVDVR